MREMKNEELRMKNGGWGKIGDLSPTVYPTVYGDLRCPQPKLPLWSTEITVTLN